MRILWQDLRYAVRMLARSPVTTAVAVLVLALGLGPNTALFTLINAFLLRSAPGIQEPGRLVSPRQTRDGSQVGISYPAYLHYRDHSQVLSGLAAYRRADLHLGYGDEPLRLTGALVSANYFDVLGVRPARGRFFRAEENQTPGANPVAVLSHGLWEQRFGSNPQVLGQTVRLNGRPFTVVGVTAKGFRGTEVEAFCELWVPLAMYNQAIPGVLASLKGWSFNWLDVVGRLRPAARLEQARTELRLLARQLELARPKEHQRVKLELKAAYEFGVDMYVAMLMAAFGALLLVACANVANLLLARAAARRQEIAVRLALGASRGRIVRQLLTESLLLCLLGAAAGLLLSLWTAPLLLHIVAPGGSPLAAELAPDVRVLGFTLLLSFLSTLLCGLAPALGITKPALAPALKESASVPATGRSRLRSLLVICQVSLSVVLLSGAGLLLKTVRNFYSFRPGFETRSILLVEVQPGLQRYDRAGLRLFYRQLLERAGTLPGVVSAGLATNVLAGGFFLVRVAVEGREPAPGAPWMRFGYNVVAPAYFRTMGVPFLRGRDFDYRDDAQARPVIILNEALARRLWGREDPVGQRLRIRGETTTREVVGVVRDVHHPALWQSPPANLYYPLFQSYPWDRSAVTLHLRTTASPALLAAAVRREVRALDNTLPVFGVRRFTQLLEESLWAPRLFNAVLGAAGVLALLLAAVGLYGVVAYGVERRTREIGVRVALGAGSGDVLRLVVSQGLWLALAGVAAGLVMALAATRVLASLLYGVGANDPATLGAVCLVLVGAALLASYIPARRAMRVDPVVALRYE